MAVETYVLCSADEFARYFDGLELIDPGITRVDQWHRDATAPPDIVAPFHAGVARKP